MFSGKFQTELETYMSDHLAGRDFFVGLNAYVDRLLGKNALGSIYHARGGYLVNAPEKAPLAGFEKNMKNFVQGTRRIPQI